MHQITKIVILHLILIIFLNKCMLVPVALHDQKVILHLFLIIWPKNGVVPLMPVLALCDTDTSINDITWPKSYINTFYQLSWPNEYSGTIDNCHWHHLMLITAPASHIASHFDHLELNKCSGVFDDAISVVLHIVLIMLFLQIKWCHWLCHQCHVMLIFVPTASQDQRVMSHLLSIVFTQRTKWCHWWCSLHHMTAMLGQWHHITEKVMFYIILIIVV